MDIMTSAQRRVFYSKAASVVDLIDVIQAQKRLLAKTKCSKSPPSTKKKKSSAGPSPRLREIVVRRWNLLFPMTNRNLVSITSFPELP